MKTKFLFAFKIVCKQNKDKVTNHNNREHDRKCGHNWRAGKEKSCNWCNNGDNNSRNKSDGKCCNNQYGINNWAGDVN